MTYIDAEAADSRVFSPHWQMRDVPKPSGREIRRSVMLHEEQMDIRSR